MQRHIAVIDPGTRVPELDAFNRISRSSRLPTTYHLPAQQGIDSLVRCSDGVAGIIVFGSGASVNDTDPWLVSLEEWLAPRLLAGVPFLGLCFGHQLLAKLLGGRVGFLHEDRRKLRGLRAVSLDSNPLWGGAVEGSLLVTHAEAVLELPPDCEVVGRSPQVQVEALAHRNKPFWGFQAHPEATTAFVANNAVPFDADPGVLRFGNDLVDAFLARVAALEG